MLPDGLLSVLRIYAVEDLDFAVYNCSANNAYDSAHLPIRFSQTGTDFLFSFCCTQPT